jgi:transposase
VVHFLWGYSDLRYRVVEFVRSGASKVEAASRFKVSRATVYNWLKRETLEPTKVTTRNGKINKKALVRYVTNNPDTTLFECAKAFDVSMAAISKMLKKLKIVKKNDAIQGAFVYEKV